MNLSFMYGPAYSRVNMEVGPMPKNVTAFNYVAGQGYVYAFCTFANNASQVIKLYPNPYKISLYGVSD